MARLGVNIDRITTFNEARKAKRNNVLTLYICICCAYLLGCFPQENDATVDPLEWKYVTNMTSKRFLTAACPSEEGIYVIGGLDMDTAWLSNKVELFDGKQWVSKTDLPHHKDHIKCVTYDDNIWLPGGNLGAGWSDENIAYDLSKNLWNSYAPLPYSISNNAVAALDNIIYVMGDGYGGSDDEEKMDKVWAYDIKANTWTEKAPMLKPKIRMVSVVIDNSIYLIGGRNPKTDEIYSDIDVYNPDKNEWTKIGQAPIPIWEAAWVVYKNYIILAGGVTYTADKKDFKSIDTTYIYNTEEKVWFTGPELPTDLCGSAAALIGDIMYLFSGTHWGKIDVVWQVYSLNLNFLNNMANFKY
jgi:N-acetylneuraminic acid mutarotase